MSTLVDEGVAGHMTHTFFHGSTCMRAQRLTPNSTFDSARGAVVTTQANLSESWALKVLVQSGALADGDNRS